MQHGKSLSRLRERFHVQAQKQASSLALSQLQRDAQRPTNFPQSPALVDLTTKFGGCLRTEG